MRSGTEHFIWMERDKIAAKGALFMDQKIEMDTHMICLEVADCAPDANVMFWLDYFDRKIQGKIHVISYRTIKPEMREKYAAAKNIWISGLAKTYEAIDRYITAQDKDDAVIIVGGERLAQSLPDRAISLLEYDDRDSRVHLQEDEDWEDFSRQTDKLFGNHQSDIVGLVMICNVNDSIVDVISKELESSGNMSICRTEMSGYRYESADRAARVLREIRNKSLQEAMDIIDKNAEGLSSDHRILCQAIACHNNGNITKAIDLLNSIYGNLQDEHRLFLAEMYLLRGQNAEAKKIFEEVYSRDRRQKGLFELGLRVYERDGERYAAILTEGIGYEPDNPMFMERYANLLAGQGKHREAAEWFRKIKTPYHELIARVNDLLAGGWPDIKTAVPYLLETAKENPELKNVALLRAAVYAKAQGHYYDAYRLLGETDPGGMDDTAQGILELKMELLGDTEIACKALGKLKPGQKDRDRERLLQERSRVLLECADCFSHVENGFGHWRKFMECQQTDTWILSLKPHLMDCIRKLAGTDFGELLQKSYIAKLDMAEQGLNCDRAIYLLRVCNSEEISAEDMECSREDVVQGICNLIEAKGTNIQRVWLRYYCSVGESLLNENPQKANDFSLSIPDYGRAAGREEGDLTAALFLMSWANAQYRLGNCAEGLLCAIAAIRKLLQVGEAVPVLEEGLNIIAKHLGAYDRQFSKIEKKEITVFIDKLKKYNKSLQPLLYRYSESAEEITREYEEKIKTDEKNITWLIDLNNLIIGKVQEKKYNDAVSYIKEYYLLAEKLLEQRKDIAPQVLYTWGNILTRSGRSVENILLGLDLFDKAMMFVRRRRQVHHQEERAALAEIHEKIVREFLCFAGLLYQTVDIAEEIKAALKGRICEKLAVCLPLSVIEEKKYYSERTVSDDVENKHQELQYLRREYAAMIKNNSAENTEVHKTGERIEALTEELARTHPYYMPLPQFKGTDWGKLQSILKPDEVVYQYVLTEMTVISILVTDKWIDVRSKLFTAGSDTPRSGMKKYGYAVESSGAGDNRLDDLSSVVSRAVADHLCEYVFHYNVRRVYVIPDMSRSTFPFAAVRYEERYLIDEVEEIINFVDFESVIGLLNRKKTDVRIVNKVFGKAKDFSVGYIKSRLESYRGENVVSITDCLDDFDKLREECRKGTNTVIVYGHGVRDPASENIEGAQTIQGAGGMISIRELLDSIDAENLILISCVGGTPNGINPEMSSGTWTGIFERFSGNIMACRWSVPTVDTMEMAEEIFENLTAKKMSFAKALLMAQRAMRERGKTQLSWAGVECWIN